MLTIKPPEWHSPCSGIIIVNFTDFTPCSVSTVEFEQLLHNVTKKYNMYRLKVSIFLQLCLEIFKKPDSKKSLKKNNCFSVDSLKVAWLLIVIPEKYPNFISSCKSAACNLILNDLCHKYFFKDFPCFKGWSRIHATSEKNVAIYKQLNIQIFFSVGIIALSLTFHYNFFGYIKKKWFFVEFVLYKNNSEVCPVYFDPHLCIKIQDKTNAPSNCKTMYYNLFKWAHSHHLYNYHNKSHRFYKDQHHLPSYASYKVDREEDWVGVDVSAIPPFSNHFFLTRNNLCLYAMYKF